MVTLANKYVPVIVTCPVCQESVETIYHALVECNFAAQCWNRGMVGISLDSTGDFYHWLLNNFQKSNIERRAEIVMLCWYIWKARNDLVWNKKHAQVDVVVAAAKDYLVQWRKAQSLSTMALFQVTSKGEGAEKWVKPQVDTIKVGVDAATFENQQAFGFGMVARDCQGDLILAKVKCNQGMVAAEMAEIMAIKEALSWIKGSRWQKVVLESDCLVAVQAIRSKASMVSPFGRMVQECRSMLRDLKTVELFFIKWSANMLAHHLARASYSYPDREFDRGDVPIDIKNVMLSDLS